jgi:hypothetical protein
MRSSFKVMMAVAALGLSLSACAGDARTAELGKFSGIWHPTSGTTIVSCPRTAATTSPVTQNVVWSTGVSSDLERSDSDMSCTIRANVFEATATGRSAPCTITADGVSITATYTDYAFVVAPDGQTAREDLTLSLIKTGPGPADSVTCAGHQSASYQKVED